MCDPGSWTTVFVVSGPENGRLRGPSTLPGYGLELVEGALLRVLVVAESERRGPQLPESVSWRCSTRAHQLRRQEVLNLLCEVFDRQP